MRSNWSPAFSEAVHAALLRCIPPDDLRLSGELEQLSQDLIAALERGQLDLPLTPERQAVARASGWLEGNASPLLIQQGDRIGWRRWLEEMDGVVDALSDRQQPELKPPLAAPDPAETLNPEQQAAVLASDHAPVVLLSGGPGTGKTSTVVELLRRVEARHPGLRLGLAAPTGKAARRLGDSVRPRWSELPCMTLHRWLEAGPHGFRRDRRRPLELDLLVIDEMSMVDLALMTALLDALPQSCRLVLVGDPAQLPPVGSGAVWQRLQQPSIRGRFDDAAVHLVRTYRNRGALADLSTVLRDQGLPAFHLALDALPDGANVRHHRCDTRRLPSLVRSVWHQRWQRLEPLAETLNQVNPDDLDALQQPGIALLQEAEGDLLLCPRRRGIWSLEDVHRTVLGASELRNPMRWPSGVPVICGANQPDLGLANGDLGVTVGRSEGLRLLFRVTGATGSSQMKLLHPARVRALEPAVALTIHRAQGSEADRVTVLWPPSQDMADDRALLYTAITRARESLDLMTAVSA